MLLLDVFIACALLLTALGETRSFPIRGRHATPAQATAADERLPTADKKRYAAVDEHKLSYTILIKGSAVTSKIVTINDDTDDLFQRQLFGFVMATTRDPIDPTAESADTGKRSTAKTEPPKVASSTRRRSFWKSLWSSEKKSPRRTDEKPGGDKSPSGGRRSAKVMRMLEDRTTTAANKTSTRPIDRGNRTVVTKPHLNQTIATTKPVIAAVQRNHTTATNVGSTGPAKTSPVVADARPLSAVTVKRRLARVVKPKTTEWFS